MIRFLSQIEWFISSPIDDFILNFLNGVFETAGIKRGGKNLPLQNAEVLEPPEFGDRMKFRCLSPITVSKTDLVEGERVQHFIRPWEPDLSEKIAQNLVRKFRLLYGEVGYETGFGDKNSMGFGMVEWRS